MKDGFLEWLNQEDLTGPFKVKKSSYENYETLLSEIKRLKNEGKITASTVDPLEKAMYKHCAFLKGNEEDIKSLKALCDEIEYHADDNEWLLVSQIYFNEADIK